MAKISKALAAVLVPWILGLLVYFSEALGIPLPENYEASVTELVVALLGGGALTGIGVFFAPRNRDPEP
jgi:hypothetical protein